MRRFIDNVSIFFISSIERRVSHVVLMDGAFSAILGKTPIADDDERIPVGDAEATSPVGSAVGIIPVVGIIVGETRAFGDAGGSLFVV